VLDRNPDNFFAETEQVAFCPANIVPGIDFSNDPLLQGRIFSYLDTQLSRLGSPNFHEIPINRPKCPMRNFQRDGHMRMEVNKGRVNYEPNTLGEGSTPRECPTRGFASVQQVNDAPKVRARSETFADHYSQARQFFRSMTPIEQHHIMNAFAFELGKVETIAIRKRMLGHLGLIDSALGDGVEKRLGMEGEADVIKPARAPIDLPPSPTLSLVKKAPQTIEGRKVGCLVTEGADADVLGALKVAVEGAGAVFQIVAPRVNGLKDSSGKAIAVKHSLGGAPSVVFDAVAVVCSEEGGAALAADHRAVGWVSDAFNHCKAIGYSDGAVKLLTRAGVAEDPGVGKLTGASDATVFVEAAKLGRCWDRELSGAPKV
jgi:catalase